MSENGDLSAEGEAYREKKLLVKLGLKFCANKKGWNQGERREIDTNNIKSMIVLKRIIKSKFFAKFISASY